MRKRFKVILTIIFILILLVGITLVSLQFQSPSSQKEEYKEIDSIKDYGYVLEDRDTLLMQDKFEKLKEVLNKDEVDYNLYAEYLSELFIIDLFTISNKDNKYDVGGLEFVLPDVQENYRINIEDTIYKYIVDKNISKRDEDYPKVINISKYSLEKIEYTFNEIKYPAYKIILNWEYEKDLGYDTIGEVILLKRDNKLYVVSYKGVEE